jgi:hypothetical protein
MEFASTGWVVTASAAANGAQLAIQVALPITWSAQGVIRLASTRECYPLTYSVYAGLIAR